MGLTAKQRRAYAQINEVAAKFMESHKDVDVCVWQEYDEEYGEEIAKVILTSNTKQATVKFRLVEQGLIGPYQRLEDSLKDDYTWHLSAGQVAELEREISKYVSASREKGLDTDEDEVFKNLVIETMQTATADLNELIGH